PDSARPGSRLIPFVTRFAPRWRRDDWRHEWEAEIAWRIERLERRGLRTRWTDLALSIRCLGAIPHLAWMWSHDWRVDMLGQDVRYALRTLAARPAFALTAIATLGLAI